MASVNAESHHEYINMAKLNLAPLVGPVKIMTSLQDYSGSLISSKPHTRLYIRLHFFKVPEDHASYFRVVL